jgi:hypothetical protein
MDGLRVYINLAGTDTLCLDRVFYSRRADGPYYRWRYEGKPRQWRVARLASSDLSFKALPAANWKVVPLALQTKLGEHYQL